MWDELLKQGATGAPQIVEWLGVGLGLVLATVLGRFNFGLGKRDTAAPAVGEIAGAIIDKSKAEEIIDIVRENTEAVLDMTKSMGNLARRLEHNTRAADSLVAEVTEVNTGLKALTAEVIRLGAQRS